MSIKKNAVALNRSKKFKYFYRGAILAFTLCIGSYASPSLAACQVTELPSSVTKTFSSPTASNTVDFKVSLGNSIDGDNAMIDILHIYVNGQEVFSGTWGSGSDPAYGTDRIISNPYGGTANIDRTVYPPMVNISLPLQNLNQGENTVTYTYDSPTEFEGFPRSGPQGFADESWCLESHNVALDCSVTPGDSKCFGNADFCAANSGHSSCAGSDAYCNSSPDHRLEPICTEGDPAYCKLAHHVSEPVCIVGEEAFCKLQHNKSNPACIVGSNEFCALPQHENHTECPGTISYCTKYPQSPLCTPIDIDQPCVAAGNCATPYQVHVTSKSSSIGIVLCEVIYYMKSGIGSAIAMLSMIMMAILVVYRKIDAAQAVIMVAGIASVLGAAHLAAYMANTVAGFSTTLNCLTGG